MGVSKVVYGSNTIIDLTSDTVEEQYLLSGKTAHGADGELITGTCEFDSDTTDADATASTILSGKTAYVNKNKITGEMPNRGAVAGTISTVSQQYSVQNGYHDGSGIVEIDPTEQAKIIASNIKEGVSILGVIGNVSPASGVTSQSKTVTPYTTSQTVLPDADYDYLSQVTVQAIAYVETDNAAGGKTVTIGTVAPV